MGKKKRAQRKNNATTAAPAYAFECVNNNIKVGDDDDGLTDDDNRNVADAAAPTTMMGLYTKARTKRPAAAKKIAARTLLGTYSASPLELLHMLRDGNISEDDFNRLTPRRFGLTQDEHDSLTPIPKITTPVVEAKEVFPAATNTTTALSIGDTVKINGFVDASKYNCSRGVIVSAVDVTTNRCGVRTRGNANVMAIQVINLTLERRAKKSTIGDANVDICAGAGDIMEVQSDANNIGEEYLAASQKERLALVDQNMSFLRSCEDAIASWARDNEWEKPILCNIIKKWREQATMGFVRFLNGNTTDCHEANLQFVSLRDVILHLDEWKVNWSINFTDLEFDMTKKTYVRQFLQHPEKYLTNINDEVGDGTDATNDQGGYSSSPPILAHGREFASARMHQSTDVVYADSHITKHIAKSIVLLLLGEGDALTKVSGRLSCRRGGVATEKIMGKHKRR